MRDCNARMSVRIVPSLDTDPSAAVMPVTLDVEQLEE